MIIEILVVGAALGVGFLLGTKKGKADLTVLKADVAALLPKVKASVVSAEAIVKTDVLALVAKIEAGLKKL